MTMPNDVIWVGKIAHLGTLWRHATATYDLRVDEDDCLTIVQNDGRTILIEPGTKLTVNDAGELSPIIRRPRKAV